jgi:hypothetical protein
MNQERMDCAEFHDVLHELDRPGTRGAAEFENAITHAESCGDCGVLLVEEESLDFAVGKVARETARMPGAARVEAALLTEFRKAKPGAAVMPARRKMQWQIAALAVAATILLALGTMIYQRNLRQSRVAPVTNVATNQSHSTVNPTQSVAQNASSKVTTAASAESGSAGSAAKPPAAASDAQGTEYATEYVRLPYADDPAALEGGSVVRVTLARSALESYGLPAEGLGTGDRVTADMLVSEDGTPQAIRLVAQED